jgi:hypothetical protein
MGVGSARSIGGAFYRVESVIAAHDGGFKAEEGGLRDDDGGSTRG